MTAGKKPIRGLLKWVLIVAVPLALCAVVFPLPFVLLFAPVDAAICVPRVASQVGVTASFDAIDQYILDNVTKGKSRSEVNAVLSRLGPLEINQQAGIKPATSVDFISIHMCLDPVNDIGLDVQYSASDQVIDAQIQRYE